MELSQATFRVDEREFVADLTGAMAGTIPILSTPRPYQIDFAPTEQSATAAFRATLRTKHNVVVVDRKVADLHFADQASFQGIAVCYVDAVEQNKTINEALRLVAFFAAQGVTKTSEVFAIGGGIVQDLVAFACAVFKRGVPWSFLPTTVLAQGDSDVGGKCALNHQGAKNILALFSPPRRVLIHPVFAQTLPAHDLQSGLGEVFRLHVTGGSDVWWQFEPDLARFRQGEPGALTTMIRRGIAVKKAVVEFDEFELNHRRSMNYGHTIGHALEACVAYRIPHGTAVAIGILVENQLAVLQGHLAENIADEILKVGKQLIPAESELELRQLRSGDLFQYLIQDKKAEGSMLVFALLRSIGDMRFVGFDLRDEDVRTTIVRAMDWVRNSLSRR